MDPITLTIIIGLVSVGWSAFQYFDAKAENEKQIKKNEELMAQQERKGKVLNRKQYNYALQQFSKGMLSGKLELLDTERKKRAERSHGTPIV